MAIFIAHSIVFALGNLGSTLGTATGGVDVELIFNLKCMFKDKKEIKNIYGIDDRQRMLK